MCNVQDGSLPTGYCYTEITDLVHRSEYSWCCVLELLMEKKKLIERITFVGKMTYVLKLILMKCHVVSC